MWDLLYETKFQKTAIFTFLIVFLVHIFFRILKRKSQNFKKEAASTLSWLFIIPFIFLFSGLAWPYSLVILCVVSVYAAKNFFQMTGMYHRSNFVYVCYFFICFSVYCIYREFVHIFNLTPIIMFFAACLIPLLRNSYRQMLQYIALTLLNFCFIWAFLHLGWIVGMEEGAYIFIYLILLTEFFDNVYLFISKYLKRIKLISNITPKRSLEGFVLAGFFTLILGWRVSYLLPDGIGEYWLFLSSICVLFGSTGDSIMDVIRYDLGIKVTDNFILGRGDFFSCLDRLVFVAPIAHGILYILVEF